ncbi:hypothetical protein PSOL_06250 [Candidatus Phytoplasma solani]
MKATILSKKKYDFLRKTKLLINHYCYIMKTVLKKNISL